MRPFVAIRVRKESANVFITSNFGLRGGSAKDMLPGMRIREQREEGLRSCSGISWKRTCATERTENRVDGYFLGR